MVEIVQGSIDSALAGRLISREGIYPGAWCVFTGQVRPDKLPGGQAVRGIEYSANETLALKIMKEIAREAMEKFNLLACEIRHSTGYVAVGELSLLVAVAATHRQEAFQALPHVVNAIKQKAPIWKKELTDSGHRWITGNNP